MLIASVSVTLFLVSMTSLVIPSSSLGVNNKVSARSTNISNLLNSFQVQFAASQHDYFSAYPVVVLRSAEITLTQKFDSVASEIGNKYKSVFIVSKFKIRI